MKVTLLDCCKAVADHAAERLIQTVDARPNLVLGLPTGGTMLAIYRRLVAAFDEGHIDFRDLTAMNVDEYVGLGRRHVQSYAYFVHDNLLKHVNVQAERIHVVNGAAPDPHQEAERYERLIQAVGGIDLLLLGLGVNGHIAFNEPGSSPDSRTRIVRLAPATLAANSRYFASASEQPAAAISIGLRTIMEARRIIVVATGPAKAEAVGFLLGGKPVAVCPAAVLLNHPDVELVSDCARP